MKTYTEHIFEELVQDNSTEAKIRRYLERRKREHGERYNCMLHPKTREELQDMIVKAIEENGPEADLNYIDVSEIDDMSFLFACHYNDRDKSKILRNFNGNISNWDVSSAENMSFMFDTPNFNGNISNWDVSSAENMSFMFSHAESFNQNLSDWDVSCVNNMEGMFMGASSFNGGISDWDVSNVTNMHCMFGGAKNFNQDLSDWDVSLKNTEDMFHNCPIEDKNKPKGLK